MKLSHIPRILKNILKSRFIGHGRYEAAKLLGLEEVPVKIVDLTEKQARAYRLADNKLNISEWNMEMVIEELSSLPIDLVDLTGFDKEIISQLEDFIPNYSPEEIENGVTCEDIENKRKELTEKFLKENQKLEVICPKCGNEFRINQI